jgi:hypothetical protein
MLYKPGSGAIAIVSFYRQGAKNIIPFFKTFPPVSPPVFVMFWMALLVNIQHKLKIQKNIVKTPALVDNRIFGSILYLIYFNFNFVQSQVKDTFSI